MSCMARSKLLLPASVGSVILLGISLAAYQQYRLLFPATEPAAPTTQTTHTNPEPEITQVPEPTITTNPSPPSTQVLGAQTTESAPDQELSATGFTSPAEADFRDKLYNLILAYRREQSVSLLTRSQLLEQSAHLKLADMIENNYYRHEDQTNVQSWYLLEQVGYPYQTAGENLAFGATSAWQVFSDWQQSPTHNTQLLNPNYENMGLAVDCHTFAPQTANACMVVLHLAQQK